MNAHRPGFRPKDFDRVTASIQLRLERGSIDASTKAELLRMVRSSSPDHHVRWGRASRIVADILRIINDKRQRDDIPRLDETGLQAAVRAMAAGDRKNPAVEELLDALCNLREERLGVRKISPLEEGTRKIA